MPVIPAPRETSCLRRRLHSNLYSHTGAFLKRKHCDKSVEHCGTETANEQSKRKWETCSGFVVSQKVSLLLVNPLGRNFIQPLLATWAC
eukprot:3792269-Amphidinium_carterae.1